MDYIAQFTPLQQEVLKLAYRFRGIKQTEIAAILKMSKSSVNECFKSKELQEALAYLDRDLYGRLNKLRDLAADHYEKTLSDPAADPWLKYYMSRDLLSAPVQAKTLLPPAPTIDDLVVVDENQGKAEKL